MYSSLSPAQDWFQGDILDDVPFIDVPESFNDAGRQEFAVTGRRIMILSQTCDIDHREHIIIAPVWKIDDLLKTGIGADLEVIKQQRYNYWFYLPQDASFPESYVDFTFMTYSSQNILIKEKRIKSLSDLGRHWLAYKLSTYFGRPIETPV